MELERGEHARNCHWNIHNLSELQVELPLLLVQHFQGTLLTTMMFFQSLFGTTLALAATATATPVINQQQPFLNGDLEGQQVDLIKEFVFP
jgi:hypothetical protein